MAIVTHDDARYSGGRQDPPQGERPGVTVEGVVVRLHARHAHVRLEDRTVRCTLRKSLFRDRKLLTQPLAVGDRVRATIWEDRDGVVEEHFERTSCLSRAQQGTGLQQVIVANVDLVVITVALVDPAFKPRLIDRLLVAAEREDLDALIVLNKVDLVEEVTPFEGTVAMLRSLGHDVLFTSAFTGVGVPELRDRLVGHTTVFAGQSGVGKSCLLNAIQPGLELRTGEISEKWKKGRHTTTAVSLLPLDVGGYVADTPGFRAFGITGLEAWEVGFLFRDIRALSSGCHFPTCSHTHEPDCAVKAGLATGALDEERYLSYLHIIAGDEEILLDEPGGRGLAMRFWQVVEILGSLLALSVLVTAALLEPHPSGHGTVPEVFNPCPYRLQTGNPCLSCGMTTCFVNMVRCRPVARVRGQPCRRVPLPDHPGGTLLAPSRHGHAPGSLSLHPAPHLPLAAAGVCPDGRDRLAVARQTPRTVRGKPRTRSD